MSPFPTGPLPRPIGPYLVTEKIGAGGMANVYRARHIETGAEVAIKVLALHLEQQPAARARFEHEAALLLGLRHPHILPVYDFGEDGDIPYLVMRLLGGRSLKDELRAAPLDLAQAATWVRQLAGALDYAHARGVIHRDVKPANVLLDGESVPFLADFGVATVIGAAQETAGEFVGTAAYAAPEQCRGEPAVRASDQYALAVVAYEMLTGRRPFSGPTALAVMAQHIGDAPPDPLAINRALPHAVRRVLAQALAKQAAARYPSALAFSRALDRALDLAAPARPHGEETT